MKNIYSSLAYLSMNYGSQTKILKYSTFTLYEILVPATNPKYLLMTSKFAEISDVWFLDYSRFRFRDNAFDHLRIYGAIMFGEFEQGKN